MLDDRRSSKQNAKVYSKNHDILNYLTNKQYKNIANASVMLVIVQHLGVKLFYI